MDTVYYIRYIYDGIWFSGGIELLTVCIYTHISAGYGGRECLRGNSHTCPIYDCCSALAHFYATRPPKGSVPLEKQKQRPRGPYIKLRSCTTKHTHTRVQNVCVCKFYFFVGLLAHYSFSPADKRSAHIKRLLDGLLSDKLLMDFLHIPPIPSRDRCVRSENVFVHSAGKLSGIPI